MNSCLWPWTQLYLSKTPETHTQTEQQRRQSFWISAKHNECKWIRIKELVWLKFGFCVQNFCIVLIRCTWAAYLMNPAFWRIQAFSNFANRHHYGVHLTCHIVVLKILKMCVYHALVAWFTLRSPEGKNVNLLYSDTTLKMDKVRLEVLKINLMSG